MTLQTEFEFTLPRGFVDRDGTVHRHGSMRLATAMDENARANPEKRLEILRTIAEGRLVAVHARVQHSPGASPAAVVHIFRFEDGRIAELWDIGQEAPLDSPNQAGMF